MSTTETSGKLADLKPRLTVIGVGGAGCNAINNMIAAGLDGVDVQWSPTPTRRP